MPAACLSTRREPEHERDRSRERNPNEGSSHLYAVLRASTNDSNSKIGVEQSAPGAHESNIAVVLIERRQIHNTSEGSEAHVRISRRENRKQEKQTCMQKTFCKTVNIPPLVSSTRSPRVEQVHGKLCSLT